MDVICVDSCFTNKQEFGADGKENYGYINHLQLDWSQKKFPKIVSNIWELT